MRRAGSVSSVIRIPRTGADLDGRAGIEWGVYGVPETFVVDKRGVIRHKIIGAITPAIVEKHLLPLVRELQPNESGSCIQRRHSVVSLAVRVADRPRLRLVRGQRRAPRAAHDALA